MYVIKNIKLSDAIELLEARLGGHFVECQGRPL